MRPRRYPSVRATGSWSRMHFRSPVSMRCRSRTWSGPSARQAFSTPTESWSPLDGKIVYETSIGGDEDLRTIDQQQTAGVDAINSRLKDIRFTVEAGQHEVAVLFARRTHAESEDLVAAFADGVGAGARMEVLRTRGFEIRGPFEITTALNTESRNRVFTCYPETVQEQDACADEIIGTLATRAYRRSLSPSEMEERLAYYHAAKNDGFENGIRTAIVGILASPHFLFRTDDVAADSAADDPSTASASAAESVYRLNDVELASKLAFFLWSSLPDEELLLLAEARRLSDPDVLEQQVRRMLADARAETLAADFAYQWLHLNRMDAIRPDPAKFPQTAGRLDPRADFLREIGLFVDSIFREDRSVRRLAASEAHVRQRDSGLALRNRRRQGQSLPPSRARRFDALGAAREGRAATGVVLSQSHVARFARRIRHAQPHRCSTGPTPAGGGDGPR